jgi:hypothetical protein
VGPDDNGGGKLDAYVDGPGCDWVGREPDACGAAAARSTRSQTCREAWPRSDCLTSITRPLAIPA